MSGEPEARTIDSSRLARKLYRRVTIPTEHRHNGANQVMQPVCRRIPATRTSYEASPVLATVEPSIRRPKTVLSTKGRRFVDQRSVQHIPLALLHTVEGVFAVLPSMLGLAVFRKLKSGFADVI